MTETSSGKRHIIEHFFEMIEGAPFSVVFWDGETKNYGEAPPEFTVTFNSEPGYLDMLVSPSLFFGEAYMAGEVDISGSYQAVAKALDSANSVESPSLKEKILASVLGKISSAASSLAQQKSDIAAHYDLGNEFFGLWLDKPTKSYSCGYFRHESDTLEQAQQQKIALILKKLQLKPGMRLLDIGCGWGALATAAARDYGVEVVGITLSEEQEKAVKEKFLDNDLRGSCEVRLCNYLELDQPESFDRVVSVGMFEHVGKERYHQYFEKVAALLKPGGLSLLHTLTKHTPGETDPWIAKRIFPGGRIPAVSEVVSALPGCGLYLLHAESLRRHYAKTLDCWYANFSKPEVLAKVTAMFDTAFVRMWSLYLRMASAVLAVGQLDVHQFLFSKGVAGDLPMTMEGVYCG